MGLGHQVQKDTVVIIVDAIINFISLCIIGPYRCYLGVLMHPYLMSQSVVPSSLY